MLLEISSLCTIIRSLFLHLQVTADVEFPSHPCSGSILVSYHISIGAPLSYLRKLRSFQPSIPKHYSLIFKFPYEIFKSRETILVLVPLIWRVNDQIPEICVFSFGHDRKGERKRYLIAGNLTRVRTFENCYN